MQRIVKELSSAVGLGGALEIVRRWGGRRLYVPAKLEDGDSLSLTLGRDIAGKLVATFPGQLLQLPAEQNALLDLRNAKIVAEFDDGRGDSQETLALRYGLTRQGIKYVIKKHRDAKELAAIQAEREARQSAAR